MCIVLTFYRVGKRRVIENYMQNKHKLPELYRPTNEEKKMALSFIALHILYI